jgi:hypothetical protein
MGLLSPWWLLAGVVGASLPLWLHLLRSHQKDPIAFSSVRFLEKREEQTSMQKRLKYRHLFLLRLLLFLLAALAFASPWLKESLEQTRNRALRVYALDNSYSMRAGGNFERARAEAIRLLPSSGGPVAVLSFHREAALLQEPTSDFAAARAAMTAIGQSDERSNYAALTRRLRDLQRSSGLQLEVHLFSDLQRSGMPAAFEDLRLPAGTKLELHPVAPFTAENFALESAQGPRTVADVAGWRIQATVSSTGAAQASRKVLLRINGRQVAEKTLTLAPESRGSVDFVAPALSPGWNKVELALDPPDAFPQDDVFRLAMERGEPRKVLLVTDPRDSRSLTYVRPAIESGSLHLFQAETMSLEASLARDWSSYAFVFLLDVSLSSNASQRVEDFLRRGGGVFLACGSRCAENALPATLGKATLRYAEREQDHYFSAGQSDQSSPILQAAAGFRGLRFFQVASLEAAQNSVLARLSDGAPLLLSARLGDGRLLAFATALDNLANDFPVHGTFVPFLEQAALWLSGFDDSPASRFTGTYAALRADDTAQKQAVEMLGPDGQRLFGLDESLKLSTVLLDREGFYEQRRAGFNALLAANVSRAESDFRPMDEETRKLWANTGIAAATTGQGEETGERRNLLWWWFFLLLFLLLLGESFYAARYLPREAQGVKS